MKRILLLIILFQFSGTSFSQESLFKKFGGISGPEKWWVVTHVFKSKKAFEISTEAREVTKQIQEEGLLRGEGHGGQVDAFRHAYWMARLTQEIGAKRAEKLGVAHEKGNKKDFEKGEVEEGFIPDKVSVKMDLKNNLVGINTGKEHPKLDRESIKLIIYQKILNGNLYILRQDDKGRFLNEDNEVIPEKEWEGSWENQRNIVPSDFKVVPGVIEED